MEEKNYVNACYYSVWKLKIFIISYLLKKGLNKTIFGKYLYGYETWSIYLTEEHKVHALETKS
jgi:hypothetical protein